MISLPVEQINQRVYLLALLVDLQRVMYQELGHINPGDPLLGAFDRCIDKLHAA
jgi:hypothetical protein